MKHILIQLFFLMIIVMAPGVAKAADGESEANFPAEPASQTDQSTLSPFNNLGNNIFNSFIGPTTLLHLSAAASTVVMVREDWDYLIYKRAQSYRRYQ